jgi:hypothetical protein
MPLVLPENHLLTSTSFGAGFCVLTGGGAVVVVFSFSSSESTFSCNSSILGSIVVGDAGSCPDELHPVNNSSNVKPNALIGRREIEALINMSEL